MGYTKAVYVKYEEYESSVILGVASVETLMIQKKQELFSFNMEFVYENRC
jgi:hypothetical protein